MIDQGLIASSGKRCYNQTGFEQGQKNFDRKNLKMHPLTALGLNVLPPPTTPVAPPVIQDVAL